MEGAKFRLSVLKELKNRGIRDVFIACVDGLKGFTEAIESVFPETATQICVVHQIRNSLSYISYKDRKAVAADLKPIYIAATENEALFALEDFAEKRNVRYPIIPKSCPANWRRINPMFSFSQEIRPAVYTTNFPESLNYSLAEDQENPRCFPDRRGGDQTAPAEDQRKVEKMRAMPIQKLKFYDFNKDQHVSQETAKSINRTNVDMTNSQNEITGYVADQKTDASNPYQRAGIPPSSVRNRKPSEAYQCRIDDCPGRRPTRRGINIACFNKSTESEIILKIPIKKVKFQLKITLNISEISAQLGLFAAKKIL